MQKSKFTAEQITNVLSRAVSLAIIWLCCALILIISHSSFGQVFKCPFEFKHKEFKLNRYEGKIPVYLNKSETVSLAIGCEKYDKKRIAEAKIEFKKMGYVVSELNQDLFYTKFKKGKIYTRILILRRSDFAIEVAIATKQKNEIEHFQQLVQDFFHNLDL